MAQLIKNPPTRRETPVSFLEWGRSAEEGIGYLFQYFGASLVAQMVKNVLAMWETWVRYLGWEDSLEKGMATHSSILAWRIPWTDEPGRLQSTERRGHKESDTTE